MRNLLETHLLTSMSAPGVLSILIAFLLNSCISNEEELKDGKALAVLEVNEVEVVGLSFSVPVFDWGLGKGRVQKAKAAQEVVRTQVQQSENDLRRQIFTAVGQFNNQRHQCSVSKRAMLIAQERYELMMEKFRSGKASVMELNTAQSENDTALQKYITDVSNFWEYYYTLRQYTLYDFIKGQDLDIDVNEMITR